MAYRQVPHFQNLNYRMSMNSFRRMHAEIWMPTCDQGLYPT